MREHRLFFSKAILVAAGFFLAAPLAEAALYAPGATLDPACAPTDTNCGIETVVASSTANSFPYYAANGSVLSATSTFTILPSGNIGIGTSSPFELLSVGGSGFFNGTLTASNLTATGTLSVAGNTTLANATSTNFFSTTASSTNLFAENAAFGSLSANALSLATALPVSSGGTASTTLSGLLKGNGTGSLLSAIPGTDYLAPSSLSATYPLQYAANTFSLAFGTTSTNSWSGTQTFSNSAYAALFTGGGVGIGTTTPTGRCGRSAHGHHSHHGLGTRQLRQRLRSQHPRNDQTTDHAPIRSSRNRAVQPRSS